MMDDLRQGYCCSPLSTGPDANLDPRFPSFGLLASEHAFLPPRREPEKGKRSWAPPESDHIRAPHVSGAGNQEVNAIRPRMRWARRPHALLSPRTSEHREPVVKVGGAPGARPGRGKAGRRGSGVGSWRGWEAVPVVLRGSPLRLGRHRERGKIPNRGKHVLNLIRIVSMDHSYT